MSDENTLTGSDQPATPTPEATEKTETSAETVEVKDDSEKTETTEQPAADEKAGSDDAKEAPAEKPKPKSRAQRRIEELARDKRNLRRTIIRRDQEIARLRAEPRPQEEDFASPADYQSASLKRATREVSLEQDRDTAQSDFDTLQAQRREAFQEIITEAQEEMPDFQQVFDVNVPVSETMADLIMDSDTPAQLAYWLGKNRAEAARIAKMESPVEAARALGQIETRLAAPKPKVISSAPAPVPTVSGKAHKSGKTPEEMTYDEYVKWRKSQEPRA